MDENTVEIRDAASLWGESAAATRERLKSELGSDVKVMAVGPAGEHLVPFATILADNDATASGGFGGVMGSKKLKAVAVKGNRKPTAADPGRVRELVKQIMQLRKGTWDVYPSPAPGRTKRQACYGCSAGCMRQVYETEDGKRVKFFCQAADFYRKAAFKFYKGWNDTIAHATRLCNEYGLDTIVIQPMMEWFIKCYQEGILTEEETGIPLSKFGSYEFIETMLRKISFREGFGDTLAQGTLKAAELVGKGSQDLLGESIATRANEMADYDPRLYITTGLLYALEPRRPIQQLHEISFTMAQWMEWLKETKFGFLSTEPLMAIAEKFWGGRAAVDFSSAEGKALAAKKIQDRQYVKESLILCDFLWPIIWVRFSESHVGESVLESRILSAVTGNEIDEEELNRIGERIFNLQRAILIRDGWGGREGDQLPDYVHEVPLAKAFLNRECLAPGRDGETISRKGHVLERDVFEGLKDEYYELRGWDVESGLQTRSKLEELDLHDVADVLEKEGFLR
ncbi:aldehyde ferredoxin oxidoreductase C-terminal domain-containing protein [Thermodesulfobacteriota bacterium]